MKLLDYSRGYPRASVIKAAGYGGVLRYLPREGTTGVLPLTRAELADMRAHGLAVVPIHQHADRGRALQGRAAGRHDAAWALARLHELADDIVDDPDIVFAVDFDTVAGQWGAIAEYFIGVGEVMGRGRNDAYGEYDLLTELDRRDVVEDGWQPYAWSIGHNKDGQTRASIARLFQRLEQVVVDGVLCDVNDVLTSGDFGQLRYREPTMTWRVARSLTVLLNQLNAAYPTRSKVSDGSIGDAAHATRDSDHNPWYGPGIVTARDFTHDPDDGIDCHKLAGQLVASGDKRIKYVIWNRRIWTPAAGWRDYTGTNPHTAHLHLSVVASPLCDDTTAWALTGGLLMALTDAEQKELLEKVRGIDRSLGSYFLATGGKLIGTGIHELESDVAAIMARPAADVDEAALADELVKRGIGGDNTAAVVEAVRAMFARGGEEPV